MSHYDTIYSNIESAPLDDLINGDFGSALADAALVKWPALFRPYPPTRSRPPATTPTACRIGSVRPPGNCLTVLENRPKSRPRRNAAPLAKTPPGSAAGKRPGTGWAWNGRPDRPDKGKYEHEIKELSDL